jgi:hypothetical protein
MATIAVQEFIALDGVFESPTWTFEYGFDPKMGEGRGSVARWHRPSDPTRRLVPGRSSDAALDLLTTGEARGKLVLTP